MSKILLRIVVTLLFPGLIAREVNAVCLPITYQRIGYCVISQQTFTVQALSASGDVFLHPRSVTARAGAVLASLAIGSVSVYESIQHPKPAILFFNALLMILSTFFANGQSDDESAKQRILESTLPQLNTDERRTAVQAAEDFETMFLRNPFQIAG